MSEPFNINKILNTLNLKFTSSNNEDNIAADLVQKRTLTESEINNLKSFKYPVSKKPILNTNDFVLFYELCSLLIELGYDVVVELLNGENYLKYINLEKSERDLDLEVRNGILYGNPLMVESIKKSLANAEVLRNRNLVTIGAYDCPKCKTNKTTTEQKKVRSSDEPLVSFNKCTVCAYAWKV